MKIYMILISRKRFLGLTKVWAWNAEEREWWEEAVALERDEKTKRFLVFGNEKVSVGTSVYLKFCLKLEV